MPWTPIVMFTVLFSVICGNRLSDNRLRKSHGHGLFNRATPLSINTGPGDGYVADSALDGNVPCHLVNQMDGTFGREFRGEECTDQNGYNWNFEMLRNRKLNRNIFPRESADERKAQLVAAEGVASGANKTDDGMLSDLFAALDASTSNGVPAAPHHRPLPAPPMAMQYSDSGGSLDPIDVDHMNIYPTDYADLYEDVFAEAHKENVKRAGGNAPTVGCDCRIRNDVVDLGQQHFPRYLLNAICQTSDTYPQKCHLGTSCKPLEYKVKVLTFRNKMDYIQKDPALPFLPDDLRQLWKFKTVTVSVGCFCSVFREGKWEIV